MSKILIIEDEEPIRRVLVRILSDEDSSFEIQEASDGKKGIDLIKKESFDLVLCEHWIVFPNTFIVNVRFNINTNASFYFEQLISQVFYCSIFLMHFSFLNLLLQRESFFQSTLYLQQFLVLHPMLLQGEVF